MKALGTNQNGFVMPAVIFVMAILTVVAIATLATASDEFKSSNALRRSVEAFYAAEAGAKQVVATWDPMFDTLSSGGTMDLGWHNSRPSYTRTKIRTFCGRSSVVSSIKWPFWACGRLRRSVN